MKLIDNFKKGLSNYIERESIFDDLEQDEMVSKYGVKNIKLSFLTIIFGITTYSRYLDIEFGKDILEVMTVINNKENFKYIADKDNHKKFIYVANLLDRYSWIEWGTSIRGCWFTDWNSPDVDCGVDYYKMDKIKFDDKGKDIKELIEYLNNDLI